MEKIILAAGCFWGVQFYFDEVPGVTKTTVGYSGGKTINPSYEQVCSHTTGHAECVLVEFDSLKVSLETIIKHFFRMHNPTQLNQQGPDIGDEYRSAIFYYTKEQKNIAIDILVETQKDIENKIVTEITKAKHFFVAEEYHQKFTLKTGIGMCHIPYTELN